MQTWSGLAPRDRTMEFAAISAADLPPPSAKVGKAPRRRRPAAELRLLVVVARDLGAIA